MIYIHRYGKMHRNLSEYRNFHVKRVPANETLLYLLHESMDIVTLFRSCTCVNLLCNSHTANPHCGSIQVLICGYHPCVCTYIHVPYDKFVPTNMYVHTYVL